jgi:hypothetical protein
MTFPACTVCTLEAFLHRPLIVAFVIYHQIISDFLRLSHWPLIERIFSCQIHQNKKNIKTIASIFHKIQLHLYS